MATLEEVIRQRLAEATEQSKSVHNHVFEASKTVHSIKDFKSEIKKSHPDAEIVSQPVNSKGEIHTYAMHKTDGMVDKNKTVGHHVEYEDGDEEGNIKVNESKSLTEEQLDEMSQEEFDAIDEEQLDELSKATLRSYIKKAPDSVNNLKNKIDYHDKKSEEHNDKAEDASVARKRKTADAHTRISQDHENLSDTTTKKLGTRQAGISKATSKLTKEDTVSSQVASLLEAEGLSEEFKTQAVTIFEAAVTDRVLQIEEELKQEFDSLLAEAKAELDNDIDGFLSEAILQWKQENEVAIASNFKSQLAESFMDGMKALIAEHNIELPDDKEDALEVALGEVDKLNESIVEKEAEMLQLQEQVNSMKADQILESFKEKMTMTEFDRFVQLTESVKFKDESQYKKQLSIVQENFGSKATDKVVTQPITEVVTEAVHKIITETNSDMDVYAKYLSKKY